MSDNASAWLERQGTAGQRAALASVLLAIVLVYGGILHVTSASADSGPLRGLAGKCVDVTGAISADGTPLVLWSCHGGFNQQWEVRSDRTIRGLGGKCLDVAGGNMQDGTPLILWSCHGGPNQQWEVRTDGTIRGLGGKCLDVTGANSADGSPLILWSCHGQPNQQWSASQHVILKRPFNILAVGDSIMWGQGLHDQNKFVTLVAESLKKQLGKPDVVKHVIAHSGAITYPKAGEEAKDRPRFPGEVPHDYPSIHYQITQLAQTKVQLADVDLVLVDGCINNIGVTKILNPFTKLFVLRDDTQAYCGAGMTNILTEVARTFPQAKVIVTGYFRIISNESTLANLLALWTNGGLFPGLAAVLNPVTGLVLLPEYRSRAAELSDLFFTEVSSSLQLAVQNLNALPSPLGGNRFRYASPQFEPLNSYGAGLSWLWLAPHPLFEKDEVFISRNNDCDAVGLHTDPENLKCRVASMGHPNIPGARAYATEITKAISGFLPEWRAAFGTSPSPDPEYVPKGVVCRSGQQGCGPLGDGTFERCIPEKAHCD